MPAETTLAHRSAEVTAVPGLLRAEIPPAMRDWPRAMIVGALLEYAEPAPSRQPIPDLARVVSRYVSEHMRMRFRPHGRRKLDALVGRHLVELANAE